MNEEVLQTSVKDKIRSLASVVGTKEDYLFRLDVLLQQLGELGCFDNDPEYLKEFKEVIEAEIRKGATRVGFFGSRAEGAHRPGKSDLDVASINPDYRRKKLSDVSMAGKINYWGSKTPGMALSPRIHINRYTDLNKDNRTILRNAMWVWVKEASK